MIIDWNNFTPWSTLAGGLMIVLAALALLLPTVVLQASVAFLEDCCVRRKRMLRGASHSWRD